MHRLGQFLWTSITAFTVALAVNFTISNNVIVTLSLWPFSQTVNVPAWLSVIVAFVVGGIIGGGLILGQAMSIRTKLWQSQSKIKNLKAQLEQQKQDGSTREFSQTVEK